MSHTYQTIIEAVNPWKPFNWKEILQYRDMFYFKIINGYRAGQRQTVMSYFWVLADPVINIIFFSIIFGNLAKIETGNTPYVVFNAAAMAGWILIRDSLNRSTQSLINEVNLLNKVYFPRVYIPAVPCIVQLPNFGIRLAVTFLFLAMFGYYPTLSVLMIIPVIMIALIFSSAIGLLLSTYVLQFKDMKTVWDYFMKILIYATPLAYPLSKVPEEWQFYYMLNPAATLVESFRACMLGTTIPWLHLGITLIASCVLFYIAAVTYRIREPNIVDAI